MPAADLDAGMIGRNQRDGDADVLAAAQEFSGSNRRKARPTSVAFGASVM